MEKNTNFSDIAKISKSSDIDFVNNQLENGWVLLEICKKNNIVSCVNNMPVFDEYVEFIIGELKLSPTQKYLKEAGIDANDILKNFNSK